MIWEQRIHKERHTRMVICWCWTALQASRELQLQAGCDTLAREKIHLISAKILIDYIVLQDSTAQPQKCLLYTARIYELAEIHFVFPYIHLGYGIPFISHWPHPWSPMPMNPPMRQSHFTCDLNNFWGSPHCHAWSFAKASPFRYHEPHDAKCPFTPFTTPSSPGLHLPQDSLAIHQIMEGIRNLFYLILLPDQKKDTSQLVWISASMKDG